MRLEGKAALVTGAASGIGRACAVALSREGARVLACDIDPPGLAETAAMSPTIAAQPLDVTQEAAWAAAVATAEARFGALHILVNNAGLCISAGIMETTLETWRRQNAVNLDGVFLGVRAALPLMARSGGGAIVNISSVAGLQGIPGLTGYCASKGGVRLFTKALALECAAARNGVRVNSVHPGAIETPIWVKMQHGGALPPGANTIAEEMAATRAGAAQATPLGFAGTPEDIAEGVVYLVSDAARFVTGTELVIDGGVFAG
ncbi:SDR family NAD(P)-dependent oxidoreductase [Phenylobacterium sp.]|uniref:SDR family NAD(P)-dependent oxidoreductase n=1 Tax=Phenylobacterium sp. TaxID=1871053 RepID=UPI003562D291